MLGREVFDPRRFTERILPILRWCKSYDLATGIGDLIAGVTVALTLIPQSIAYASLAGLEPQYGLYASFAGGFIYAVTGTCPQINIGPTALLSLLTFTYTNGTNPDFAVLLCFMAGVVQLVAGVAQLGFLVDFVSVPVVSGFTSAAAVTIASSQVKGLLGLSFKAETFVGAWRGVLKNIEKTKLPDTLLSLACCIVLMGMKALKDIHIKEPLDEKAKTTTDVIRKSLWFIGVARNAVVVLAASLVAYLVHEDNTYPLSLTGNITPGLPVPRVPPFYSTVGNTTYSSGEMFSHLGTGLLVVPLVGIISNVAIAKAFSKGKALDATQEIVALGICNIIGSFFSSFPVNGSFTRSAVSDASGVRTPLAGFYTGAIVLLTLALLTPFFYFIPRPALAAVITCAVLHMVDIEIIKKLWWTSRFDLIPLLGTFILCLGLGIEVGLLCGVVIDVILLLFYHSRPSMSVELIDDGVLPRHYGVRPHGGIHFAAAEKLRTKLTSLRNPRNAVLMTRPITFETLTVIPDNGVMDNRHRINGMDTNRVDERNVNGNATTIVSLGYQGPKVLVVYCEGLQRLDFTVLQSIKSIDDEWSNKVIWYAASPTIKEQLSATLHSPVYCDSKMELIIALNIYNRGTEEQTIVTNDTQL